MKIVKFSTHLIIFLLPSIMLHVSDLRIGNESEVLSSPCIKLLFIFSYFFPVVFGYFKYILICTHIFS